MSSSYYSKAARLVDSLVGDQHEPVQQTATDIAAPGAKNGLSPVEIDDLTAALGSDHGLSPGEIEDLIASIAGGQPTSDGGSERSPQMSYAIAELVRGEGEEPLTDEEIAALGAKHGLSQSEIDELVEIGQGPIGP